MKKKIKKLLINMSKKDKPVFIIKENSDNQNILLQNGKLWSELLSRKEKINSIHETEFKVFSQWGDDGIIQFLINSLDIKQKVFIEFGVADYLESNTRFLLMNNNWSGLIMDGSDSNIKKIKNSDYYWKYDLKAKSAFITKDNINQLIEEEEIKGEIGLLHIDIDGNDYWIWKEINSIDPIIVIVEYNSVFGSERAITIPYKEDFFRTNAHYSNLYAGTSISSLYDLAEEKGYSFVGSNSAGNNAYFVKKGYLKNLNQLTVKEGYVESKFRESRDKEGRLSYISGDKRLEHIKGMPIYNTRTKSLEEL